jgi:predicted CoA-binding protein
MKRFNITFNTDIEKVTLCTDRLSDVDKVIDIIDNFYKSELTNSINKVYIEEFKKVIYLHEFLDINDVSRLYKQIKKEINGLEELKLRKT